MDFLDLPQSASVDPDPARQSKGCLNTTCDLVYVLQRGNPRKLQKAGAGPKQQEKIKYQQHEEMGRFGSFHRRLNDAFTALHPSLAQSLVVQGFGCQGKPGAGQNANWHRTWCAM
eukprot:s486_g18.t1